MIINLDKDTRIVSGTYSWDIQKKRLVKGEVLWHPIKYYSTFKQAVMGAYQLEIRTTHAEGLDECISAAESVWQRYNSILDSFDRAGIS